MHNQECLFYGRKMKSCMHEKVVNNKCPWLGRPEVIKVNYEKNINPDIPAGYGRLYRMAGKG
jgi:hypothetical protein